MLTTDANLELWLRPSTSFNSDSDQLTNGALIDGLEWITWQNSLFQVINQKAANIIARESKTHLRQIIGTEGEKLCFRSDFICC